MPAGDYLHARAVPVHSRRCVPERRPAEPLVGDQLSVFNVNYFMLGAAMVVVLTTVLAAVGSRI